jgi:hypothetical protein
MAAGRTAAPQEQTRRCHPLLLQQLFRRRGRAGTAATSESTGEAQASRSAGAASSWTDSPSGRSASTALRNGVNGPSGLGRGGGGVAKVSGRKKMGIEEACWSPQINEFLKGRVAAQAASVIVQEQTVCVPFSTTMHWPWSRGNCLNDQ